MKRQYIELNEATFNFDNKSIETTIEFIDEGEKEIHEKKILVTKKVWKHTFSKLYKTEYKGNEEYIKKVVIEWLNKYAAKIKSEYENNWSNQPDKRIIQSYEIKYYKNIKEIG